VIATDEIAHVIHSRAATVHDASQRLAQFVALVRVDAD